jgi:hypothetical protein
MHTSFNNQNKQGSYTIDATRSAMYLQRKNFPLNEFETTVTFVNRDGKPGMSILLPEDHYIADAPLCVA